MHTSTPYSRTIQSTEGEAHSAHAWLPGCPRIARQRAVCTLKIGLGVSRVRKRKRKRAKQSQRQTDAGPAPVLFLRGSWVQVGHLRGLHLLLDVYRHQGLDVNPNGREAGTGRHLHACVCKQALVGDQHQQQQKGRNQKSESRLIKLIS
eukprot:scaffold83613_cov34-Tisochrysis_lutea.AAC.5